MQLLGVLLKGNDGGCERLCAGSTSDSNAFSEMSKRPRCMDLMSKLKCL